MYFLNPKGRKLLLNDKVSAKFYLANAADISKADGTLDKVTNLKKFKIFIAGKQDGLIPVENLEKDAIRGGFQFFAIDNASHFITFDQPERVARLIEEKIVTIK